MDQKDIFAMAFEKLGDKVQLLVEDLLEIQPCPRGVYDRLHHLVIASHDLDAGLQGEGLMALHPTGRVRRPSALLARAVWLSMSRDIKVWCHAWLSTVPSR